MAEAQSPPPASSLPNGTSKITHDHHISKGAYNSLDEKKHSLSNNDDQRSAPETTTTKPSYQTTENDPSSPPLSAVTADLHARVNSFLSESHDPSSLLARVQKQTRISLSVINEARARYKLSELSLSYNGGKDCLVMLILFLSSLHQEQEQEETSPSAQAQAQSQPSNPLPANSSHHSTLTTTSHDHDHDHNPDPDPHPTSIPAIYALPPHPFPSVESFVLSSSQYYHLSLTRYTTSPPTTTIRSAFASYLDLHPQIRAIFVGTRRTDPHGGTLKHFDRTDHGWPDFMRIHPVIDWHYAEIWAFIRHLGIEYCPLYDEGYTSLGGTNDTHPNPKLMRKTATAAPNNGTSDGITLPNSEGSTANATYRPAYELMDDDEERLGRD